MPATVSVLYPATADGTFDMSYYLNTHMPLVWKQWGPHGLQSTIVSDYKTTGDGSAPPFIVQAALQWESSDSFKAVADLDETKLVYADIPKYTNIKPVILVGENVQSK